MAERPTIHFAETTTPQSGCVVVFAGPDGQLSDAAKACDPQGVMPRAFEESDFKGALGKTVDLLAPSGTEYGRILVVGAGKSDERKEPDFIKMGGSVYSKLRKGHKVSVVAELSDGPVEATEIARFAFGAYLRSYVFDRFKTKQGASASTSGGDDPRKDDDKGPIEMTILCADPKAAEAAWGAMKGIADGVLLAREVVDLPANILGPVEFAERAETLSELGVEVEVLTEKEMTDLKMGALLGVAQGSVRPPRLVVMRWNGAAEGDKPIAFVGKGVVFDTGGISIKPSGGMEDMKGDMGGAAAVIGLMHGLAARKAKANVVGILGLVENMPDGNAQRPGDIVTSMSGQTIEVINTDAEGRLVLADALHYCRDRFSPGFMVNLATLTGAIMVALGSDHAGLFSNNDELSERLTKSGLATEEKVWRLPLGKAYDKLIDSKNADMKNVGGRYAGSITAAQFLQRFVGDTPWAHLDVAGTALGSPQSEISGGWASGFGVRLLDRLVADYYEGGEPPHV